MILYPNCKLNIGLRVISKRADGYHNLETLFYPVFGLCDRLEITPSAAFSFTQGGIVVDCPAEDNLIIRCYRRMRERYPQIGDVKIVFDKHIPFGAGLGGGSSDAAHTAIALNEIFGLGLSREQLAAEVAPLGADCAFFVYNTPCLAEGIGEVLTPVPFSLDGFRLVMLKPDIHVSTREAYGGIRLSGDQPSLAELVRSAVSGQQSAVSSQAMARELLKHEDIVYNDFERTVFPLHPELAALKKRLQNAGAFYAAMSGSGSTVYGLFRAEDAVVLSADNNTADSMTAITIYDGEARSSRF